MRKFIAMLLAVVMVFGVAGSAVARTPEEITAIRQYLNNQVHQLIDAGNMSNDEVYGVYVELYQVPQGSISATVYETASQQATVTTYSNIKPQAIAGVNGAKDKLHRFLAYLDNNNPDTFIAMWGSAPADSVMGYVYGEHKADTLNSFVAGIPECLGNIRLYDYGVSGGGYSPETKTEDPEAWAEKYLTATFTLESTTYTKIVGETIETLEMDVKPYIKNGRTYVPVRYLAYSLGAPEEGVTWEQNTKTVGIFKDEADITLTIGSTVMLVNQEPVQMDAAPEIKDGRTMLPARWVAEALGAEVEWDAGLQQAIIKMPVARPED